MTKRTLQILAVAFFVSTNIFGQTLDTKKFRKGTFYTKQAPDYGHTVRTKSTQTSYYKKNNMELSWKIAWTSDTTYILTFDQAKNSDGFFKTGDKIHATITAIDGDCYSFKATFFSDKFPEGKAMPPADMCLKRE